MSMFNRFNRYQKQIALKDGSIEKAVFTRVGRSNSSNFRTNFVYTLLLKLGTAVSNGDLVKCEIYGKKRTFIIVSIRHTDSSVQATAYECNCNIEVYRSETKYDDYDNEIGHSVECVLTTEANYVTVNSSMRMMDAGLLPSSTIEFRNPICDIRELDSIVLDGENYCVDAIDKTKFFGMLAIQVSYDERSL